MPDRMTDELSQLAKRATQIAAVLVLLVLLWSAGARTQSLISSIDALNITIARTSSDLSAATREIRDLDGRTQLLQQRALDAERRLNSLESR